LVSRVSIAVAAAVPEGVTVDGARVQVAFFGAPEQARVTC
jgi:hypothetical protein